MFTRSMAASAIMLATALTVTACSPLGDPPAPPATETSATAANPADRMFVMMMIPHHEQAIEMAEIVLSASDVSSEVADLAERIRAAQQPEIDTMEAWLDDWGMPTMDDMHHDSGMLSEDEVDELRSLEGLDLERLFLSGMIEHHEGAIDMAEDEIAAGVHPDVIALAQSIVVTQTAEIEEMRELLRTR